MSVATGLRTLFVLALLLSIVATAPLTTRADTIIPVTTTADDLTVNGNCTLREAVIAANTDAAVDGCAAGSGADAISLPAGTYTLQLSGRDEDAAQTGDLDILNDLSIQGAGSGLTVIDGNDLDRIFQIVSAGAHVAIEGVSILNGNTRFDYGSRCGGGIHNAGVLVLRAVDVAQNEAYDGGGLCTIAGASFNIADSTIRENESFMEGGGIYNAGYLEAHRVLIHANESVAYAGGLFNHNSGNVVIMGSRIEANSTIYEEGGGVINGGVMHISQSAIIGNNGAWFGGGIVNPGHLTLINSLIAGNIGGWAGGGICNCNLFGMGGGGTIEVTNCTVTGNTADEGSAIANPGTATVTHSTIRGTLSHWGAINYGTDNDSLDNPEPGVFSLRASIAPDCDSPVISQGYNLDTGNTCGLAGPGDLSNTDPRLGPLGDNGGPTHTMALLPGSPAIDAIPVAECSTPADQRNMTRPQPRNGHCDIGAYEFSPQAEIRWLVEDVKQLQTAHALTNAQKLTLLYPLKTAELALINGDPATACVNLAAFGAQLNAYVTTGFLTAEQTRPSLDAAQRVRALICN